MKHLTDKRLHFKCRAIFALAIFLIVWMVTMVLAADASYMEHAKDITSFQWWIIGGLLGLVQLLIGYIYVSGITSVKESIRKLFDHMEFLEREKVGWTEHDRVCDKPKSPGERPK